MGWIVASSTVGVSAEGVLQQAGDLESRYGMCCTWLDCCRIERDDDLPRAVRLILIDSLLHALVDRLALPRRSPPARSTRLSMPVTVSPDSLSLHDRDVKTVCDLEETALSLVSCVAQLESHLHDGENFLGVLTKLRVTNIDVAEHVRAA